MNYEFCQGLVCVYTGHCGTLGQKFNHLNPELAKCSSVNSGQAWPFGAFSSLGKNISGSLFLCVLGTFDLTRIYMCVTHGYVFLQVFHL